MTDEHSGAFEGGEQRAQTLGSAPQCPSYISYARTRALTNPTYYLQSDHWADSRGSVPFRWERWAFSQQQVRFPATSRYHPTVICTCRRDSVPTQVKVTLPTFRELS